MSITKSLEAFYAHKFDEVPKLPPVGAGDFNVFRLTENISSDRPAAQYARHDFYKIMLIRGQHRCHFAEKSLSLNGSTLLFFNPATPYQFERLEDPSTGFFCVFKEAFFTDSHRKGIHDLPMFVPGGNPVYQLNQSQDREADAIFERMLPEINSDYRFKYDLLRNYVSELIHFAMKMNPSEQLFEHPDSNARITSLFTDLLEHQFPIESLQDSIQLRSASDFAGKLGVHVNHLNRAVRLKTGKTTTTHIAERIVAEATALLKHTNWNIADISYCLGFPQPAHFTYFYKKHTHFTPTSIRLV